MNKMLVVTGWLAVAAALCSAETVVERTSAYTDAKLGLTVVAGTLSLPSEGMWRVVEPAADVAIRQVYLRLSDEALAQRAGNRSQRAQLLEKTDAERSPLWMLWNSCHVYAAGHSGTGPESWEQVKSQTNRNALLAANQTVGFLSSNYFLVPGVKMQQGGRGEALIVQLHPGVDDGKTWIAYSGGAVERVPVDTAFCAKYRFAVTPLASVKVSPPTAAATETAYRVLALARDGNPGGRQVMDLINRDTGQKLSCSWNLSGATAADRDLLQDWASVRGSQWAFLSGRDNAPVLEYWLERNDDLYGGHSGMEGNERPPNETANAFSVLGGRAAVRETLQMQALRRGAASSSSAPSVPIADVTGVTVTSHPFGEMLKTVNPRTLALADSVPADRAFVYVAKPSALLAFLDQGQDFLFTGGSLALKNTLTYDLKERYLQRLGFTEAWLRDFLLKSGVVKELAVLFPDLFFIEGTDLTVLARLSAPNLAKPALALLGLTSLSGEIHERPGVSCESSFWVMDRDMLIVGTDRQEVQRVLDLRKAGGQGSLGQSAEFRYMLAQLPVEAGTRMHAYLSDPFIRRLVGPAVKIGQLRRLAAKGELESLTAAGMLYKLDGQPGNPEVKTLVGKGYLPVSFTASDDTLGADGQAVSLRYGTPARLATLARNPVTSATAEEVAAYKAYVENYSRFWRQYFDPIAFRLDDTPAGGLALTTFILPLVDNTIYNGLKQYLKTGPGEAILRVPALDPDPILLLSFNLSDDAWVNVARGFLSEMGSHFLSLDPKVFDRLGPGLHLAVQDSDPVITFGSGDALGAFGAPLLAGGQGGEMMAIPLLVSILTRPTQLFIELQDPETVVKALRACGSSPARRERGWSPEVTLCRVGARDAWICSISMEGVIRIRFGVEVQNGYLILSNLPWSPKSKVKGSQPAQLNAAALALWPDRAVQQLPSLFTAAAEQDRACAMRGLGELYPFMACGAASVQDALAAEKRLFGFASAHPGDGQWLWENGELRSSLYGTKAHSNLPEYTPGKKDFGLFQGLKNVRLNLQFEDAGLRAVSTWDLDDSRSR